MLVKTVSMYAMPASHKTYGLGRGEHVIATYRAITVYGTFDTFMVQPSRYCDARTAFLPLH